MCMVIDFIKYKAEREMDVFFTENDLNIYKFSCPDCNNDQFNIFLNMTAKCSECGLEILMTVEDDEL